MLPNRCLQKTPRSKRRSAVKVLGFKGGLRSGDDAAQRRKLHHFEGVGEKVREGVAHGLRKDYVEHGLEAAEAGAAGGFGLAGGDGVDAGAEDLAVVGAGVEEEGDADAAEAPRSRPKNGMPT